MPYIDKTMRDRIDPLIELLRLELTRMGGVLSYGNLNYIITRIITAHNPQVYNEINGLIGVLECAKLELYRRIAAPYEDQKILENGDVY